MLNRKLFPETIAGYHFRTVLSPEQPYRRFLLAEYVHDDGRMAIAKRFHGHRWQLDYYRFRHEVRLYESYARLTPAQRTMLTEDFPRVRVPKYITTVGTGTNQIILIEKVAGQPISTLSPVAQAELYEQVTQYIQRLGTMVISNWRLPTLSTWYQLLTAPAIAARALRRSWADRRLILMLLAILLRRLPSLLADRRTNFVHRDLWPNNILVDNHGVASVIDFDVSAAMHPYVEVAKLTLGLWPEEMVRQAWLSTLTMQAITQPTSEARVFQGLAAYAALFEWGMPTIDRRVIESFSEYVQSVGRSASESERAVVQARPTVTVGIPAFNEALSLAELLAAIRTQDQDTFQLADIVVLSDGSTDDTVRVVETCGDQRVRVVHDPVRRGKPARMNQLFEQATSDIVVILDADISLAGNRCLSELIRPFSGQREVALVSGQGEPLPPDTFIRRVAMAGINIWNRARATARPNDIYFCEGTIRAFHRRLYSQLRFPATSADDIYPYLYCEQHGLGFARAPLAIAHYTLPSQLTEYINQQTRFAASRQVHQANFDPDFVQRYFTVTAWMKLRAMWRSMVTRPLSTTVYLLLWVYVQWRMRWRPVETTSLWTMASSTKVKRDRIIFSSYDDVHNPYYGGGGAIAVHQVAKRLALSHDVMILTGKYPGATETVVDGVRYRRIGTSWFGPKIGQLLFALSLPWYVLRLRYDVWIESFTPPFSTSCLQLFTRKQVIGLVHLLAGEEMYRKYGIPFYWIERWGLRTYRRFIVLSEAVAGKVRQSNPKAAIDIIRNGVDLDRALTRVDQPPYITFVGRIEMNQKGIDLLLQGFARVAAQVPYTLAIAGSGIKTEVQKLEAMIHELHLEDRVTLLGRVTGEEKQSLFANSAFIVLPSRHETFSLVALEALAHHLPLVAFDIVGLEWLPTDCWMKVPAFDTDLLAQAIRQLADDAPLRQRLMQRGSSFIQSFSWDAVASQYERSISASLQSV